jgi:YHS domain-containing protein
VLCTEATRDALGPAVPVRERGRQAFKNLAYPITLYELVLRQRAEPALPIDPVCRMAVDPVRAAERRVHGGIEHFFCAERCALAFDEDPAVYLRRTETTPSE